MRITILFLLILALSLKAESIKERTWTSAVGSKIVATATHIEDGKVCLLTKKGKMFMLELSALSAADQALVKEHFYDDLPEEDVPYEDSSSETQPDNSEPEASISKTDIIGPIKATETSSYYYYLPSTLPPGGKAPILFWTGAGESNADTLKRFTLAADLTGVALAASVEAKNQDSTRTFAINNKHTAACLKHIGQTLPVDPERVFFSGSSGGGASAWYNASKLPSLGAMPFIAYIPRGASPPKTGLYYVAGGARDYNRYLSAQDAKKYAPRATHRIYTGAHTMGEPQPARDGLIWLYTRHIMEARSQHSQEFSLYEKRLKKWITSLAENNSRLATYWTDFLLGDCALPSDLQSHITQLNQSLLKDTRNVEYLQARKAVEGYSEKHLAGISGRGSKKKHTTKRLQKSAAKLQKKFDAVPGVTEILTELGKPTD